MQLLRSNSKFRRLWSANIFSALGGWALGIALSVHVFELTRSAVATGALVTVSVVPSALFGSASGVLADRVDRVVLMRWSALIRIALTASLLLAPSSVIALIVICGLNAVVLQLFIPAEQATIADLVPSQDLPRALGLNSAASNAMRLAAPAAGGATMTFLGYTGTIVCILGTLIGAAVLLLRLTRTGKPCHAREPVLGQWTSGLNRIRSQPNIRAITALHVLDALKEGALSTLFPVIMLGVIGTSATFMGVVNSSFALTAIFGGPPVALVVHRLGYRIPIAVGTSVSAAFIAAWAAIPSPATALAAFALSGLPFTISSVATSTLLLLSTDQTHRGRVVGAVGSIDAAIMAAAAATAGLVAAATGPLPVLAAAAALQMILGPLVARRLREPQTETER